MLVQFFRSLFERRRTPVAFRRSSLISIAVISLSAVVLAACSLAAPAPVDTAPSNSQAPFAQPQAAQPVELPTRRPSVSAGAPLYEEKCVRCHGAAGRGDGTMAAQIQSQFGSPVSDLTSDVVARAKTPEYWYQMVANGRLEKGMPGFASLDVNQRWDVIVYAWSLSAPSGQIERGREVYVKQCVQCHGEGGQGDGPDAEGTLSDFTQFATFAKIEAGKMDQELASTHIPSFAGTTSELERRASIDYIRTFAFDYAANAAAAPATTPAVTGGTPTGTTTEPAANPTGPEAPIGVSGYIVPGTAGQTVPGNLPITFYIFPGGSGQTAITETFQTDAQGRFTITTTQAKAGDLVAATTSYKDLNFFSELTDYAPQVTLPITIYENTPDGSAVQVATLHIVATPGDGGLAISEIYVLNNPTDRIVAGFGQPVMAFNLPAGATQVSVDSGSMRPDTLVESNGQMMYFDAIPVGENAGQVVYQYTLPGGTTALDRSLAQDIGSVNVLVEGDPAQIAVKSDLLTSAGPQTIQGKVYQQFRGSDLKSGQRLGLSITPPAAPVNLTAILGAGLILVGVVGLVLWLRGRSKASAAAAPAKAAADQRDALIDLIADLDDDFAAGQIDEVNYRAKRAKLKERLLKLM